MLNKKLPTKYKLLVAILVAFSGLYISVLLSNDNYSLDIELPIINSSDEYSKIVIKNVLLNTDKEIVKHIRQITVINRGGYNPCRDSTALEPDGCVTDNYEQEVEIYLIAIEDWNDSCNRIKSPKYILTHEIGHIANYHNKNLSNKSSFEKELEADNYSSAYIKKYENCKPKVIIINQTKIKIADIEKRLIAAQT